MSEITPKIVMDLLNYRNLDEFCKLAPAIAQAYLDTSRQLDLEAQLHADDEIKNHKLTEIWLKKISQANKENERLQSIIDKTHGNLKRISAIAEANGYYAACRDIKTLTDGILALTQQQTGGAV